MYNSAPADPSGAPWSERKKLVWWQAEHGKWGGLDVPDFKETKPPDYRPNFSTRPEGMAALGGADPFIMMADGRSMLFVPSGLKDGPLSSHYEPPESPVLNAVYGRQINPGTEIWNRPGNAIAEPEDPRFPYISTTYRLTELHYGGIATRAMPHTAELQPEGFVEMPPELAATHDVRSLDTVVLSTLRGEIEVKALVTDRLRPFVIQGHTIYQIGMPWVYGWKGYARGAVANVLLAITGDPNVTVHSTKALSCGMRKKGVPPA